MRLLRAWIGLVALVALAAGCGEELNATLDIDMGACFVQAGRRLNDRALNKEFTQAVCVAGLPEGPQTMCLAVKVGSQNLAATKMTYTARGDSPTRSLSGGGISLPSLNPEGETIRLRPFFLRDGETDCGGIDVDTDCAVLERCLFSLGEVKETVKGNGAIQMIYGKTAEGLSPCEVTCNRPAGAEASGYLACWFDVDEGIEFCDGVDNDCSGEIDDLPGIIDASRTKVYRGGESNEPLPLGGACQGKGACGLADNGDVRVGQVVCVAAPDQHPQGLHTCCDSEPDCPGSEDRGFAAPEVCDDLDNDCNGLVDEDFPAKGDGCPGIGRCTGGTWECDPERPQAVPGEENAGLRCSVWPAQPGGQSAGSEDKARPEVCDRADNDCDGEIDEDFFGNTAVDGKGYSVDGVFQRYDRPCDGVGACGAGRVTCRYDNAAACCSSDPGCDTELGPDGFEVEMLCDGQDNNCDGETDEGFAWSDPDGGGNLGLGAPCGPGCGDVELGEVRCAPGGGGACCTTVDEAGCPSPYGREELCDGEDNDCDGETDEDFLQGARGLPEDVGLQRGCVGHGVCGEGTWVCVADPEQGSPAVEQLCCDANPGCRDVQPQQEVCNADEDNPSGLDDDCDGLDDVAERIFTREVGGDLLNLGDRCRGEGLCREEGRMECGCPAEARGGCEEDRSVRCSTAPGGSASPALPVELCNTVDDDCDGVADADETEELQDGSVVPLFRWWDPVQSTFLGLDEPCGNVGRCGPGLVVCACPPDQPDCAADQRRAWCNTMPGGPFSEGLDQELCNGQDDDCDGVVPATEEDPDRDGYLTCDETTCRACVWDDNGTERLGLTPQRTCERERMLTPQEAGDLAGIAPNPANPERCDGLDNNCSGAVDEAFALYDSCGRGVCAGGENVCHPVNDLMTCCSTEPDCLTEDGNARAELCNGLDDNCDGNLGDGRPVDGLPTPDEVTDNDGDGVPECGETGCLFMGEEDADRDGDVHPAWAPDGVAAHPEACDGKDNNCDGDLPTDEQDSDGDGLVLCEEIAAGCRPADDPDGREHGRDWGRRIGPPELPGQESFCDGADNDCDGQVDEGFDVTSDPDNCGACGSVCMLANVRASEDGHECKAAERPACEGQACCGVLDDPGACEAQWYNINQLDDDGCEYSCGGSVGAQDAPSAVAFAGVVDANCDGIDGDLSDAVFVAPDGDDADGGSMEAPVATLQRGLALASAQGRTQVLVAAGTYTVTEPLMLRGYVGLYGGYCRACVDANAPLGWKRGVAIDQYVVRIRYEPDGGQPLSYAVGAVDLVDQDVYLDRITIEGANARSAGRHATSVALYVNDSRNVVLRDSTVVAGTGFDGGAGGAGRSRGWPWWRWCKRRRA